MLMEQEFQLKEYGKLDLFEQAIMSAEARRWWMRRIRKHQEEQAERDRANQPKTPRIPRIRRK